MSARRSLALLSLAVGLSLTGPTAAQPAAPLDPHAVYEQRCNSCHNEHGGDFARQKLRLTKDRLDVSRTGQDLEALLRKHHGVALAPGEWPALASLFRLGLSTGGVFGLRCGRCHDRGATLAREKLEIFDGQVVLRATRQELSAFLKSHHQPTAAEIETLVRALRFSLETAPKPATKP